MAVKTLKQMELSIDQIRKRETPRQALSLVIKLYGEEFEKANAEIARLRKRKQHCRETLEAIRPLIVTAVGFGRDIVLEKIDEALERTK